MKYEYKCKKSKREHARMDSFIKNVILVLQRGKHCVRQASMIRLIFDNIFVDFSEKALLDAILGILFNSHSVTPQLDQIFRKSFYRHTASWFIIREI